MGMFDPHICAARYQFLKEVWRGRDRVVYDPDLVTWLASSSAEADTPWRDLLGEVLPSRPGGSVVWAVVSSEEEVMRHASALQGCRLVTVEQAFDLGADALWSVAMVEVSGELGPHARDGEPAGRIRCAPEVTGLVERFVEELGRGRTMCVSVGGAAARAHEAAAFADFFDELVPDATTYLVAKPTVAVVYPLGVERGEDDGDLDDDFDEDADDRWLDVTDPPGSASIDVKPWRTSSRREGDDSESDYDKDLADAEQSWTGDWSGRPTRAPAPRRHASEAPRPAADDGGELPVGYDNSLGDEDPAGHAWLAVLGRSGAAEEVTLVELGGEEAAATQPQRVTQGGNADVERRRGQSEDASQVRELKARLNQARLRADAAVIEHQRLTEVVHALREQAEEERPLAADAAALEAELISARWNLTQANEQIEGLRGRPVTELEALVCSLRAQVGEDEGAASPAIREAKTSHMIQVARDRGPSEPRTEAPRDSSPRSVDPAPPSHTRRARERAALKSLLRKLERGGGSALEFHAELRAILAMVERS